jgi:S1-C subfamily serine protease
VTPGSAAAVAGIQAGDIIQKFNGEGLENFKALTQKIGDHFPGDEVTLAAVRNGQLMEFKVKLGKWKSLEE